MKVLTKNQFIIKEDIMKKIILFFLCIIFLSGCGQNYTVESMKNMEKNEVMKWAFLDLDNPNNDKHYIIKRIQ